MQIDEEEIEDMEEVELNVHIEFKKELNLDDIKKVLDNFGYDYTVEKYENKDLFLKVMAEDSFTVQYDVENDIQDILQKNEIEYTVCDVE